MISLFFPIFYRQGMFFPSDLLYAQSIFNTGNISNEPDSHRQLHRAQAQGTESHAGAAGAAEGHSLWGALITLDISCSAMSEAAGDTDVRDSISGILIGLSIAEILAGIGIVGKKLLKQ